jgi:glycosyltransferase involved in cell wall biosynthesis
VHAENAEGDGHEFRALALQGFLVSYSLIKFIWARARDDGVAATLFEYLGVMTTVAIRAEVLVIGGGNVEIAPDGCSVTKGPIADYLHELSDRMGHCVWMVQRSGTWGVDLRDTGTSRLEGRIDPEKVTVVPIEGTFRGTFQNWFHFIRYALQRPYAVFFIAAFVTMTPLQPFMKFFFRRSATYLAGDYELMVEQPSSPRWPGWKVLSRYCWESAMRHADFVIARGSYLAKIARRSNARVIETLPMGHMLGAETCESRELAPDQERHVLYIGLLINSKGMSDLLKAIRLISDRRPEPKIILDVLGDGADRPGMEAQCSELGIESQIHFHGWIDSAEQMTGYFSTAHALVMPSSTHPEGVPRSIDEALVRHIPVIATRIAGVPDEFEGGEVLLVDRSAPEQMADGIEAVLFDPAIRIQYIEGAARRRDRWEGFGSAAEQHAAYLFGESPRPAQFPPPRLD